MNEPEKHEHGHHEEFPPVEGDADHSDKHDDGEQDSAPDLASLLGETSPSFVTPILIAISTLIFVAMVVKGVSFSEPSTENLLIWGANWGPASTSGEFYRLLTAAFVHIGIIHILFNMACLFDLGMVTEKIYGSRSFLLLYIVSALGGSVASMIVQPAIVSAGASGAVFGTAGALLAFFIRNKNDLPPGLFSRQVKNMGGFVLYNLIFGFSVAGIDNAAHIGGLATGFFGGFLLCPTIPFDRSKSQVTQSITVCVAAALVLGGGFFMASSRVNSLDPALKKSPAIKAQLLKDFNSYVDKLRPLLTKQDATVNKLALIENRVDTGVATSAEIQLVKIEFIENLTAISALKTESFKSLNLHMIHRAEKLVASCDALIDVIAKKEKAAENYGKILEGAGEDLKKFSAEKDKFMKDNGFITIK
ncbi:MAG: rhomboid family intramembrane serine protease [Planctomycetota bacterium]|nr:rhomboid family intramembrane serine protease [Planctomycetota bacterium]